MPLNTRTTRSRSLCGDGALLEAEAIGHPLIERSRVVRNDVRIGGAAPAGPRVLVVSGSNMSGKSTLLRTLGVNAVLAQAGAPVRARRLRMSPLAVGASIRVTDSLQGGVSRFYAEILRLRQILDATARPGPKGAPVLFLIDEFLHGTNSHDRRIGAEAVVRGLVERGAIGLDHHPRPGAGGYRRRAGRAGRQRAFRRPHRRRPDRVRLRHAAGRGAEKQRHRVDAFGGAGDLTAETIRELARECGFELAGVAAASRAQRAPRSAPGIASGWPRVSPARCGT